MNPLNSLHVLLQVHDSMLPGAQPLRKQTGGLLSYVRRNPTVLVTHLCTYGARVGVGNRLVAGDAGHGLLPRGHGGLGCRRHLFRMLLFGMLLNGMSLVLPEAAKSFHGVRIFPLSKLVAGRFGMRRLRGVVCKYLESNKKWYVCQERREGGKAVRPKSYVAFPKVFDVRAHSKSHQ